MMANNYWLKQNEGSLLFPDLAWSKPENKLHAGKLLIIGGNEHGFSAPAQAFAEATTAGIGSCRVLLPDTLQKVVGTFIPEAEYGPSTPSGSFAGKSLDSWLDLSSWADGVLLPGDLGRNSETAVLLEKFIQKYHGQLTLTDEAVDNLTTNPMTILQRAETSLVLSFEQLQKLAAHAKYTSAFTSDMDLIRAVDTLHAFTESYPVSIVTKFFGTIIVAAGGEVSTTKSTLDSWRTRTAAHTSVWWLQHPDQQFKSLTTAVSPRI